MSSLLFEIALITPNLILFVFLGYFMLKAMMRENELKKREEKIDAGYHQVVDNALTKERKILEDATSEADQIIAGAQYVSQESKDVVKNAIQKMTLDIEKQALDAAQTFTAEYQVSLKQLTLQSLTDFQKIVEGLKTDLKKELEGFHTSLLPKMEQELDDYKKIRMEQTDKMVMQIVQTVSQELLNKTISLEDHKKLVTDSLEKAKKAGAFD